MARFRCVLKKGHFFAKFYSGWACIYCKYVCNKLPPNVRHDGN